MGFRVSDGPKALRDTGFSDQKDLRLECFPLSKLTVLKMGDNRWKPST